MEIPTPPDYPFTGELVKDASAYACAVAAPITKNITSLESNIINRTIQLTFIQGARWGMEMIHKKLKEKGLA